MDFDIPTDLINKSQIGFRELAGLQSYNPILQSPPSIVTLEASILTLDPSPENLRCNYCQGKLLRGLQSLICVYCGEYQKNDEDCDPIRFNSTHGYSWLLQSLNFNGSERIGSLVEGSGINGGHSPAEDEATLSELLDLKISWPKKPDNKISKRNSSVDLGTADVDNFFIESKRATVSNVVPEEIDQDKAVDDDSSGWNAEFQSADTEIVNETSKSADSFVGAEVDLSSQMDAVFGQMESFNNKKPNDDSDMFPSDDPFANMSSEKYQLAEPLDSVVQANDGLLGHLDDKSKSVDEVFGPIESFNNRKPNDDSDLFPADDPFANMSSENFQQAEQLDSVIQANHGLAGPLNDLNSVEAVFGQMESFNNRKVNDNSDLFPSDDLFANMSSESFQKAEPLDSVVQANDLLSGQKNDLNSKSVDQDWFNDDNWQKSGANLNNASSTKSVSVDWFESTSWLKSGAENTATVKDDNLFDVKPLIGTDLDNLNNTSEATDWFQDSQWSIGASSSSNIAASKDNDDDGFDEWNDFTSSTGNQDSFLDSRKDSSNEKIAVNEKMSELNLFPSTTDPQEVAFGNFLQSADLFSGSSSNKKTNDNQTEYDIFSEVSTASRNANAEAGNIAEGPKNEKFAPNTTTSPKDDVQMLISQMHDLSFMLKSELSIPSKPDNLDP